jgi:hypothetical protein
MAFWIKRPGDDSLDPDLLEKKTGLEKPGKKDDAKNIPKRIDNLRIPERLGIQLRSFGTQNVYSFWTKDLSATGAFVLCLDFGVYPFQPSSTIIEATVELRDPVTNEVHNLPFMAKVARVVEAHGAGAALISGFGLRIIHMDFGERQVLETFIASHGKPDSLQGRTPPSADVTVHYEYDYDTGIGTGGPPRPQGFESHLEGPDHSEQNSTAKQIPEAG